MLDLDDTLYLERDYVRSGFEAAGAWAKRRFGVGGFSENAHAAFDAGTRGRIFDVVLQAMGVRYSDDDIRELVRVYREHTPRIALAEDAADFVTAHRERFPLCLITDGALESQVRKVSALGLANAFDLVVFTDAWGRQYWKPHERAYLQVQETIGLHGNRCVYIGDNPTKDFTAPLALGWRTIRVRRQGGLYAHLPCAPGLSPDIEVDDLWSVTSVLAN